MRIFILGARAESSLPPHIWLQLTFLFPNTYFHIFMIGPQVSLPSSSTLSSGGATKSKALYEPPTPSQAKDVSRSRDEYGQYGVPSSTQVISTSLTITSLRASYSDVHPHFGRLDPYTDMFFAFCPGFGFPSPSSPPLSQIASPTEWGPVVPLILESKCPLFVTGFSPTDVDRDVRSLDGVEGVAGEFDWIVTPGQNPFGSEKWEVADFDPRVMVKTNWGVWGIRGKRREVLREHGEEEEE
jgi:splicing suppressor protein 51